MDIRCGQRPTIQKFWPSTSFHWNKKDMTRLLGPTTTSLTVLQICWLREKGRAGKGSLKQKKNPRRRRSPRNLRRRKRLVLTHIQNLLKEDHQHRLRNLPQNQSH